MIAYTGMETISNLAEETRDPVRDVPLAYKYVAGAVFAIYLTLPSIALMALPVHRVAGGGYDTLLGQNPPRGYANDPVLGIVNNIGLHGFALQGLRYYVGVLAGTILIIAANAGVIGSSRITYSLSSHRQLPERLRRLHPRFKTPWLSLIFFSGLLSILTLLPGKIDFLGTMYSFGAMLSFAIANASIIALRYRFPDAELQVKGRPNLRIGKVDWPLFAILGFLGTASAWLVVIVQRPVTRWVGFAWLGIGFATYIVYRTRVIHEPLTKTVVAPPWSGPAAELEYRNILVPIGDDPESELALVYAAGLAAERGARMVVVTVIEIPLELPLDAAMPEQLEVANALLDEARAIGQSYGVRVVPRLIRARSFGRAVIEEARGPPLGDHRRRRRAEPAPPPADGVQRDRRVHPQARALPRARGRRDSVRRRARERACRARRQALKGGNDEGPPRGTALRLFRGSRSCYAETGVVAAGFSAVSFLPKRTESLLRSAPPSARTRNPIPVSSSATPTTIPKFAIWVARYDVLRAVASAVSVTQTLRPALSSGCPLGPFCAAAASFVPLPSAVA